MSPRDPRPLDRPTAAELIDAMDRMERAILTMASDWSDPLPGETRLRLLRIAHRAGDLVQRYGLRETS